MIGLSHFQDMDTVMIVQELNYMKLLDSRAATMLIDSTFSSEDWKNIFFFYTKFLKQKED